MKSILKTETFSDVSPAEARATLAAAPRLHWIHWFIIIVSLAISLAAWQYSASTKHSRAEDRFDREAEHVVELVQERMKNYEDALWGGVALISANHNDVNYPRWREYANSLHHRKKISLGSTASE